jgi:hypothetical protein
MYTQHNNSGEFIDCSSVVSKVFRFIEIGIE